MRLSALTLLAATALSISPAVHAQGGDLAWASIDTAARAEVEDKGIPSLTIAVVAPDRIVWSAAYGFEDAAKKRPATLDSVYRVGSLTEVLTGLLAQELVSAGSLDLERPVQTYLPDFKPANPFGGAVTVRMLQAHTSGLVQEPPVGSHFSSEGLDREAVVRSLNATTLVFAPGTTVKHSSAGMAVLGRVLEVVTGMSFEALVQERLLKPYGMHASGFGGGERERAVYAQIAPLDASRFAAPLFETGTPAADGLYASARDLANLLMHRLIPRAPTGQGGYSAIPAFSALSVGGRQELECEGRLFGFSSDMIALQDRALAVVVLSALDNTPSARRLARYAADVLRSAKGRPLPPWPRSVAYGSEARRVEGVYRSGRTSVVLRVVAGRLYLEAPTAAAEVRRAGGEVVLDDVGTYSKGLQIHADRGQLVLDGDVYSRAAASKPLEAKPQIQEIVGEYGAPHNYIRIYERDGSPYARVDWFRYLALERAGNHAWRFPKTSGPYSAETIEFKRDERGRVIGATVSGVALPRRDFGAEAEKELRDSMRPISALRAEARAESPPAEPTKRASELLEILPAAGIRLDIRYATTNDFLKTPVYTQARAFLQRPAAQALRAVAADLAPRGFGLTIHDAYRPWFVTKMFWDATPDYNRIFVADPAQGSRHNRGAAVDLTLHELTTGQVVQMTGDYDEMSSRSYPLYLGGTSLQRWRRDLLREVMEAHGFTVYEAEWWHFDFDGWEQFPISNLEFDQVPKPTSATDDSQPTPKP